MEINTKKLLVQNNKNFKRQQKMLRKMNDMKENLIYGGGQKYLKAVNNINNNNQLFQTIEQIYSTTCKNNNNNYLKNINTTENDYSHEIDDNEANVADADCCLDFDCDQEINRILNAKNNLLLLKQKNYLILNSYCFNNLSSASSASSASTNTRHLISSAFHSSRKICTIGNKNKRPFLDLEKMMMRV